MALKRACAGVWSSLFLFPLVENIQHANCSTDLNLSCFSFLFAGYVGAYTVHVFVWAHADRVLLDSLLPCRDSD